MSSNNTGQQNTIAGAITFPSRSEGNVQSVPIQPRQPRNLQGLLRFAMEATKSEDAPGNSQIGPMDEERRKFLEEALKSLTVDVAEVLRNAIKVLSDTEKMNSIQLCQPLPDDVKTAFNNLLEFIDDLDIANDFYKMGGFAVFPICYGSDNEDVRALASSLLGELCQNNPFCQARALECGLVNVLLNLIASETGVALTKCLFALSCATREFPPACCELLAQGGCESLGKLLAATEPDTRTKAAFLVRYLIQQYPEARAKFIHQNIVKIIAEPVKKGRDQSTEHLLSTLQVLIEDANSTVLRQLRDPTLDLKKTLIHHLKHPDLADDTFREEKEYCQQLLEVVANGQEIEPQNDEDGADR